MRRFVTAWLAMIAVLALLAVACGGRGQQATGGPPVPDRNEARGEPIIVGAIFDLSGPTSDVGVSYSEGMRDYVEWRNQNGGVEGRPIKLLWQDYQYEVPKAEQLYRQYVDAGAVAFQGHGTGDTEALRAKVTEDQIPFMSGSFAATLTNPEDTPYNFVVGLSYSDQMRVALDHIAAQSKDEHVEVAVFHHDSPFGASPLEDGRRYIEDNGLDIGYQAYAMPKGATDYVGELARARRQGAGYIIVQNTSKPAAVLAKNVKEQGMGVQIFCLNYCADEVFVQQAGDAAEGALGVLPFAPPSQASGDMRDLEAALRAKGRSLEVIGLHYPQGWYTMAVMVEGIANVVRSGKQVTGPAVKEALETMGPVTTPVTTAIQFSPDSHQGMQSGRVYQIEAGAWQALERTPTP
ncbi:MAG: ABC transporter substrate-binding protein [Egibacteraceae bacterium]